MPMRMGSPLCADAAVQSAVRMEAMVAMRSMEVLPLSAPSVGSLFFCGTARRFGRAHRSDIVVIDNNCSQG